MSEKQTPTKVEETTTVENQSVPFNLQVDLQDIAGAVSIIDLASSRGAFKGNELSAVGHVRDRLTAFVIGYQKAQKKFEEENTENKE